MKTLEGYLSIDSATGNLAVLDINGNFFAYCEYDEDRDYWAAIGPLLLIRYTEVDGDWIDISGFQIIGTSLTPKPVPDPMRIALCLIKRKDEEVTQSDIDKVQEHAARLQAKISAMFRIDVKVHGVAYVTTQIDTNLDLNRYNYEEMLEHLPSDMEFTHYIGWGGNRPGSICGRANLGFARCWTYEGCGFYTHFHEWGHLMGLGHSGEGGDTYGDDVSIMGAREGRSIFLAPHRAEMGLYGSKIGFFSAQDKGKTYLLANDQTFPDATPEEAVHFIEISTGQSILGLGHCRGTLRLYRPSRSGVWATTNLINDNVELLEIEGLSIEKTEGPKGTCGVYIYRDEYEREPIPDWELAPPAGTETLPGQLEGLWGNGSTHQGLVIWRPRENHPAADVILGWVTWDTAGSPRWLYMLAKESNDKTCLHGKILSTKRKNLGGSVDVEEGDGIVFAEEDHLVFHYRTSSLGTSRIKLHKTAQSDFSNSWGWFAFEGLDKEGLWVSSYQSPENPDGTLVAYWLTHDRRSYPRGTGQIWHFIDGPLDHGGEPSSLKIYSVDYPQFPNGDGYSGVTQVGTASISQDMSQFVYDIDGKSGTLPLRRVFNFN